MHFLPKIYCRPETAIWTLRVDCFESRKARNEKSAVPGERKNRCRSEFTDVPNVRPGNWQIRFPSTFFKNLMRKIFIIHYFEILTIF